MPLLEKGHYGVVMSREELDKIACWMDVGVPFCGDYAEAARYARWQVEIEPWREEAHRQLMRVLGLAGQRSEALNQYQVLCRILPDELNARPSSETLALAERIRLDQLQPAVIQSALPTSRSIHNLPADFNAFIGRAAERRAIHARLDQPYCRLVTLAGPGGAGKTRLAIAAAQNRRSGFDPAQAAARLQALPR